MLLALKSLGLSCGRCHLSCHLPQYYYAYHVFCGTSFSLCWSTKLLRHFELYCFPFLCCIHAATLHEQSKLLFSCLNCKPALREVPADNTRRGLLFLGGNLVSATVVAVGVILPITTPFMVPRYQFTSVRAAQTVIERRSV